MPDSQFTVELTRQAEKDLRDLRPWTAQAARALMQLEPDPQRGHTLTGSLKGARSLEFALPGSGVYRAVYSILNAERVCLVFIIGPHENIYAKAERRYAVLRRAGEL
jgi:mRNA-degrading endonuclease RelE of RelBE toxin-antitoxin system